MQLADAAQLAVDEKAVDHRADIARFAGVTLDVVIGYRAGKAPIAAVEIESQQVVTVGIGFADPQFADHAAFGQRLVHVGLLFY